MTYAREQDLTCSGAKQFAVSLMHLELKNKTKEDYMKVEESKAGIGLQIS